MNKPVRYLGKDYKPVDFTHDLSKGQRSYLREQGISEESFKRMGPVSQSEWKEETKENAYNDMRNYKGTKI
jgi:hypothetical protein